MPHGYTDFQRISRHLATHVYAAAGALRWHRRPKGVCYPLPVLETTGRCDLFIGGRSWPRNTLEVAVLLGMVVIVVATAKAESPAV